MVELENWYRFWYDKAHVRKGFNPQKARMQNCASSSPLNIHTGIPQGSALGPLLFLIFINDLPQHIENASINVFADDSAVYTAGKSFTDVKTKLQQSINSAATWFNNNRLSVNTNKTICMTLGTLGNMNKLSDEEKSASLVLNNTNLEQVVSCPYLGVHVDQNLKWDGHILNLCKKISQKLAVLFRLRKVLSERMLCQQYLLCIQPCIDDAISVWGSCSEQNKALISHYSIVLHVLSLEMLISSMLVGQISWKNLGDNLLIYDGITIP